MRRIVAFLIAALALAAPVVGQSEMKPEEAFADAADFGKRFFEAGNFAAALPYYEKADSLFRDQPAILYNSALVLVRLTRYDDAQQRLERYRLLHPAGRELEAVKALQRDIQFAIEMRRTEKREDDYRELFNRARFLYQSGQKSQALEAFREAERLFPDDPALLVNEAALHEEGGNLQKALELYKRYMETNPPDRAQHEPRIFELEREILDSRTRIMCPYCGEKLQPGSRWCHRCWHGSYDAAAGTADALACASSAAVTRTSYDLTGKVRGSETIPCLYPGKSLSDFLAYRPRKRAAVRVVRAAEGWSFGEGDVLSGRSHGDTRELKLEQDDYLRTIEDQRTGEVLRFSAHATSDGLWLLDSEPFMTADQQYAKQYSYDSDGRLVHEQVAYQSVVGGHLVAYDASYAYGDNGLESATVKGGYDGSRPEGTPQVRWELTVSRMFDPAGRITREELQVRTHQKTWTSKPYGGVGRELRRLYPSLRVNRPIDLRAGGDVIGTAGSDRLVEALDLRPLYTFSSALAVIVPPGVTRMVIDYAYADR